MIVNGINANELRVNKLYVQEIVTPTNNDSNVLAYIYINNRTYPIIKRTGFFYHFNAPTFTSCDITLYPHSNFIVYDNNNRVITKVTNPTDDFVYNQVMDFSIIQPYKFIIKNV